MRHPFAMVQCTRSHSFLPLRSPPVIPERESTPQPTKRRPLEAPPLVPPLPSILPLDSLVPHRSQSPPLSRKNNDAAGHYVKHSSKLTLVLSGQREGICVPHYSDGDAIEGILAIARPSGVVALEVKVEGLVQIQEVAGAGSFSVKVLNQKLYSWSATGHSSSPPKVSFRYALPSTFVDPISGSVYPLPPTYTEELHGIPGFSVKIAYAIVVNLALTRELLTLWRGVSNVRVPFRYTRRTRPSLAGPFPRNPQKSLDSCPRTLYVFEMRSFPGSATPSIKVHLYLPLSTVCSFQEPIPFHVTLFAEDLQLEPFAEYRPLPSSFLPLSSPASSLSCEGVQNQLSSRKAMNRCPLKIRILRTTIVDAGSAGFTLFPTHPRHRVDAVRDLFRSEGSVGKSETENSCMHCTQSIGQGVIHSTSRRLGSVGWSGAIIIPPSAEGFSGGFEVNGLKVMDSIMLSIDPPPACRSQYLPLNEAIPLKLTSDSARSRVGILVSSMG